MERGADIGLIQKLRLRGIMEFLKKIRLKHAGFVLGVVFLVSGWIIRLAAAFVLPESVGPLTGYTLDRIGYYLSGSSVVFLLGGIVFWAVIVARETKEEPQEPLTEEQVQERRKSDLEDAAYTVKNSIPFGTTQKPKLWDYADNIDTIVFLTTL